MSKTSIPAFTMSALNDSHFNSESFKAAKNELSSADSEVREIGMCAIEAKMEFVESNYISKSDQVWDTKKSIDYCERAYNDKKNGEKPFYLVSGGGGVFVKDNNPWPVGYFGGGMQWIPFLKGKPSIFAGGWKADIFLQDEGKISGLDVFGEVAIRSNLINPLVLGLPLAPLVALPVMALTSPRFGMGVSFSSNDDRVPVDFVVDAGSTLYSLVLGDDATIVVSAPFGVRYYVKNDELVYYLALEVGFR